MYQLGDHVSLTHSFPDGPKDCSGVVSHLHNEQLGFVVVLDEAIKEKKEILVLASGASADINRKDNKIPMLKRKSQYAVGDNISFRHKLCVE
jgi:hypothetical protein